MDGWGWNNNAAGEPLSLLPVNQPETSLLHLIASSYSDFFEDEKLFRICNLTPNDRCEDTQTDSAKISIFDPTYATLGNGVQEEAKQGSLAQR